MASKAITFSKASSPLCFMYSLDETSTLCNAYLQRACAQAYRQAIANASKSGVAHEAVHNVKRGIRGLTESEARQILGVTEKSSWDELLKRHANLFERNAKTGSFYLQSKVHRAKECLEAAYQKKPEGITTSP